MRAVLAFALLALPLFAQSPDNSVRLERITAGLSLPVDVAHAGDGSGRLFVVEQAGRIRIVRDGAVLAQPFLDIRDRVLTGGEQGLLGLAFPPGYRDKRYFYVNYTAANPRRTVIARFRVTADADVADPASEQVLLTINQPFPNHNGGQLLFSPKDGFLYIGMGDGGSGGDPENYGQRDDSLLGKMLRIDVEGGTVPYGIPRDNPGVLRSGWRPEVWAKGLRNPWRFAFDRVTGDLYIADVGQSRAEEVNFQPASSSGGENYGWRLREGLQCFSPQAGCPLEGLTQPIFEYLHSFGSSITGGRVYRGTRFPSLTGQYLFADYISGRLWATRRYGFHWDTRVVLAANLPISAFGEDEGGEVYLVSHRNGGAGELYRVAGTDTPYLSTRSVVNAASYVEGAVPGSIVSLFGSGIVGGEQGSIVNASELPLPIALEGVRVLMNGQPAPLFAVANTNGKEQINLQVPWEVSGTTARLQVERAGRLSNSIELNVLSSQPAFLTWRGEGRWAAAVADQLPINYDQPEAALPRGAVASFYLTGLGATTNNPRTGDRVRGNAAVGVIDRPTEVTIAGRRVPVTYVGLAPTLVGVYQLNVGLPADLLPAGEHEMRLTLDGQTAVTMVRLR